MSKRKIKPVMLANASGYDHIPSMHVRFGSVLKGTPSPANQTFTRRVLMGLMDEFSALIHQSGYSDEISGLGMEFIPSSGGGKVRIALYDENDEVLAAKNEFKVTSSFGELHYNYAHLLPSALRQIDVLDLMCFRDEDGWEKPTEGVVYFMNKSFMEDLQIGKTLERVGG